MKENEVDQKSGRETISLIGRLILLLTVIIASAVAPSQSQAVPATQESFKSWLAAFKPKAVEGGIRPEVYDRLTQGLSANFGLPDLDIPREKSAEPEQPEFVRTPERYLAEAYMSNLVTQGRQLYQKHKAALIDIEKKYGVDPALLLGLWGRETAFGNYKLPHNAIQVLATLAYAGRRSSDFQQQFIFALKMVQDGVIAPEDMHSSWAGAMGLVQFLPSDYYKYAVDEDGDGKKDIWNSVPDALASVANNLKSIGWERGVPWGIEVDAPASMDCALGNLDIRKTVAEWLRLGIKPLGGPIPERLLNAEASLLQPAGTFGPAFLTFQNFQIIREYNRSDLYALFVGHLADRIHGMGGFMHKWQPVTQVPSSDVEDMQRRLAKLGLYQDKIDGKAGGRTRTAVGLYQKRAGLPQTCWPTAELIADLRRATAQASEKAN